MGTSSVMSALSGKLHAISLLFPPRFPAEKQGTSPVSEATYWAFWSNVACEKSWFCLYSVLKKFCHLFKDLFKIYLKDRYAYLSVYLSIYLSSIYHLSVSLAYLSIFLLSIHLSIHSFILTNTSVIFIMCPALF